MERGSERLFLDMAVRKKLYHPRNMYPSVYIEHFYINSLKNILLISMQELQLLLNISKSMILK